MRTRAGCVHTGRNRGIAEALVVSPATVEKHLRSIFAELELDPVPTEHRRVLAVPA
jgi:DNA-binding NarL/FixJ family response regulator